MSITFLNLIPIIGHPLEPGQGMPIHVKRGDWQAVLLGCGIVIKEMVDLEDPNNGFGSIKPRNIEFQAVRVGGKDRRKGVGIGRKW